MAKKKLSLGDIVRKLNEEKASQEGPLPIVASPDNEIAAPLPIKSDDEAPKAPLEPQERTNAGPVAPATAFKTIFAPRETSNQAKEDPRSVQSPTHAEDPKRHKHAIPRNPDLPNAIERQSRKSGEDDEEESEFDLFRYIGIIIRRRHIVTIVTIVFTIISIFQYLRSDKNYTANARLLFKPDDKQIIDDTQKYRSNTDREKLFNTHLELLKSNTVLSIVCDNLSGKIVPLAIQKKLTIRQGVTNKEANDIIELAFSNPDPEMARDVVNELCKTYIDYRLDVNSQEVTRLLFKFEVQISKLQTELDEKESNLRRFKEDNRMVQLSDETNLAVTKLSDMEIALQQTQLTMVESNERLTALQSQIGKQDPKIIQSITFNDPTKDKIGQLELEYNSLSAEYSSEHFKVKMIKQQIEKLKAAAVDSLTREVASRTMVENPIRQSLLQDLVNLTVERSALEAKRVALEQVIEKLNTDLMRLPSLEQKYAFLQRETESLLEALKLLKNKYEETKIRRDSQETDIKILELADLPQNAVGSVTAKTIFIGFLIGLILGIALAFLFEYIDQSIKDPIDVEKGLDLPLLGIVPLIETNKALVQNSSDLTKSILEPFRALRANLKHLAQTYECKTFMVASAVKGEGKTTLAANLAITFALDGKKVILIDADLRRSQQHTLFAIPKEIGLSDFLLGTHEVDAILKKTVYENLWLVTSGERPHNPAELIGTYRFDVLIKELRERADFVIFDSPALLPVSDGITMAPKMDACVMVFRTMWTPLKAAKQAKYQLTRIGTNILGGIFNGVTQSRGYYPYYYGYYGYYSYSKYNYEEEQKKKFSFRGFGLLIENGLKKRLSTLRYSFPRYLTSGGTLLTTILKKRGFWTLAVILIALVGTELWLRSRPAPPDSESTTGISYLGSFGNGADQEIERQRAPAVQPIQNVPPAIHDSADTAHKTLTEPHVSDTTVQRPSAIPDTVSAAIKNPQGPGLKDSFALWLKARNERDISRFSAFYDSIGFKYPGRSFAEVRAQWYNEFTQATNLRRRYEPDSMWQRNLNANAIEVAARLKGVSSMDTIRLLTISIWQQRNTMWRIIREKEKLLDTHPVRAKKAPPLDSAKPVTNEQGTYEVE